MPTARTSRQGRGGQFGDEGAAGHVRAAGVQYEGGRVERGDAAGGPRGALPCSFVPCTPLHSVWGPRPSRPSAASRQVFAALKAYVEAVRQGRVTAPRAPPPFCLSPPTRAPLGRAAGVACVISHPGLICRTRGCGRSLRVLLCVPLSPLPLLSSAVPVLMKKVAESCRCPVVVFD